MKKITKVMGMFVVNLLIGSICSSVVNAKGLEDNCNLLKDNYVIQSPILILKYKKIVPIKEFYFIESNEESNIEENLEIKSNEEFDLCSMTNAKSPKMAIDISFDGGELSFNISATDYEGCTVMAQGSKKDKCKKVLFSPNSESQQLTCINPSGSRIPINTKVMKFLSTSESLDCHRLYQECIRPSTGEGSGQSKRCGQDYNTCLGIIDFRAWPGPNKITLLDEGTHGTIRCDLKISDEISQKLHEVQRCEENIKTCHAVYVQKSENLNHKIHKTSEEQEIEKGFADCNEKYDRCLKEKSN
jgi:hypothetical protein